MKLGLGNQLVVNPVNSVPLGERPTLGVSFDRSRYTNPLGFANQAAVGSSDFKLQSYAGPSLTFTRASAATFRGSNGLIQYAPENLLPRSQEFNNAVWVSNRLNVTGTPTWVNAAVAPDGTSTADFLIPDNISGNHRIRQINIATANVGYTLSFYAKANGYNYLGVQLASDASFAKYFEGVFNLSNGSIENTGRAVSYSGSRSIENVGNGWYRCSIAVNTVESNSTTIAGVVVQSTSDPTLNYTGDNTSGIYIWGAQLERSSTVRPYISTTTAARYGPRFEYDLSGNPLGLLMEEQSQNLLRYSEQFDNASFWTPTNITVAADQITSPSGLLTADKLTTSGAAATQRISYNTTQTGSSTYSIYVKAGTASFVQLMHGSSANIYANFNISTGVTGNVGSSATSSITSVGNGWYRCVVSATVASTSSWHLYVVQSNTAAYGAAFSATVANLYVWGAQLEAKSFATSYIPTVATVPLTRNADTVSVPIGTWYNTDTGTILVEGSRFNTAATTVAGFDSLFDFYNSTAVSSVLRHAAVDYEQFEAFTTGFVSIGSVYVDTEVAPNLPIKFGLTYDSTISAFAASVNNSAVVSASGIDPLETPQTLRLGLSTDNSYWNGYIKSFSYTTKYRPDNIQALTA